MRFVLVPLAALLVAAPGAGCGGDDEAAAEPPSFEGVPWVLASGVDVEGWEAVAPSVGFEEGRASGTTGCNRFTAQYTIDGEALEIGEIASTRMACPAPADAVERAYVAALGRVTAWREEDEELALLDADGAELLRYRAATPVGSWQATGLLQGDAVTSVLSGAKITASFVEGGVLTGSAGCNTYNASYATDGGRIEIAKPATTKKTCPEPAGIMEQEAAYLAALPLAASYRVAGRSLELLGAEGTLVASFARGPGQ
jgi:heat shock protein HslJ